MTSDHRRFRARWVLACAVAELVGIGAAAAVAVALQQAMGQPRTALQRWAALAALAGPEATQAARFWEACEQLAGLGPNRQARPQGLGA